jgi:hypothetical protein
MPPTTDRKIVRASALDRVGAGGEQLRAVALTKQNDSPLRSSALELHDCSRVIGTVLLDRHQVVAKHEGQQPGPTHPCRAFAYAR